MVRPVYGRKTRAIGMPPTFGSPKKITHRFVLQSPFSTKWWKRSSLIVSGKRVDTLLLRKFSFALNLQIRRSLPSPAYTRYTSVKLKMKWKSFTIRFWNISSIIYLDIFTFMLHTGTPASSTRILFSFIDHGRPSHWK